MTDTTAPTTFEPDWQSIRRAAVETTHAQPFESDEAYLDRYCGAMASEYQRQMAEAGFVVVQLEDLGEAKEIAHNCLILPGNPWFVEVGNSIIGHIDDALGR